MTAMLANLAIFLVAAGVGAGLTYAVWRVITHDAAERFRHE